MVAAQIFDYLGASYNPDSQGLFLWGKVGPQARELSDRILYEAGVFITPGFIFGHNGEEYLRISLCSTVEKLQAALGLIQKTI